LNKFIFYFPETHKYLSPENQKLRYPLVPFDLTNTYGLFIDKIESSGIKNVTPIIKFIPALDYKSNTDDLNITVNFTNKFDSVHFKIKEILKGYFGNSIQPDYAVASEEKRHNIIENHFKRYIKDGTISNFKVEHDEINTPLIEKPFILFAKGELTSMIEKAGDNILFKVGELIGPQTEIYHTINRKYNIENQFNRDYVRTITIQVPEGFQISNLNDLYMDYNYTNDNNKIYNFTSDYKMTDKTLTIHIDEYYKEINCPVEHFEEFSKVVNAAADFNKITLVIKPQ